MGWMEGSFTDEHSSKSLQPLNVPHTMLTGSKWFSTLQQRPYFRLLCSCHCVSCLSCSYCTKHFPLNDPHRSWWSRDAPLPSARPVGHVLQTLLIALIFGGAFLLCLVQRPSNLCPISSNRFDHHGRPSYQLSCRVSSESYLAWSRIVRPSREHSIDFISACDT